MNEAIMIFAGLGGVPIVTSLTNVCKPLIAAVFSKVPGNGYVKDMEKALVGIAALGLGVAWVNLTNGITGLSGSEVWAGGIIVGLVASGYYDYKKGK